MAKNLRKPKIGVKNPAAAALLLEKEKISRDEFEALLEKEETVPVE